MVEGLRENFTLESKTKGFGNDFQIVLIQKHMENGSLLLKGYATQEPGTG